MKKKKQMKIILAVVTIIAVLAIVVGGWLMMKPGGLKAEEKNTPSINSVGTSGDITEKFKADVNKVLRDTAPEPAPYNPNPSVIDNGDGTKTFIAAYNTPEAQVNVTGLGLLNSSGNPAPWTSNNNLYPRGIKFTIKIVRNNGEYSIEPGDKILIPITMSEREKTLVNELSIPNIGEFQWINGSGYEGIVDQTLPEELTQTSQTNYADGMFAIGYNAISHSFYWKPVTLFFGDREWGILESTQIDFPTIPYRDSVSPGAYSAYNSAGAVFTDAFYFENINALQSRLKGKDPAPIQSDIIQMQKLTFTSKSKIYKYFGMEKEALKGGTPLSFSNETGEVLNNKDQDYEALDFYSSVDLSSVDLSGDFGSQWKAIKAFMENQDTNTYGIVKIAETANTTTFIAALKINTQKQGLKLTDTSKYLDYYQETVGKYTPSPADFFYKTYGIEYDEPLKSKVNAAYQEAVYYNLFNMKYHFADGTLPYHYELQYVNDVDGVGTNPATRSGDSIPNKILADGQTMVVVQFVDAETNDSLKNVEYIIGEPTTPAHPDQAVILPSVLEIPGYVLDKDKLPKEIADEKPDGSWWLDFPTLDAEDKRTNVTFYYKKLPTINLEKTGADNNALPGVTMSLGAKVTTSAGEKLMSLPALYKAMTNNDLDTKDYPLLVTNADGKIAMPNTDPRIATMWDLQSQGSGGTVQSINQWVFVETQAADKYQPSPFNTFDTTGGQSGIPVDYQNQFVFNINPALEIGEGKSSSATATNKLNQFKVQPTAINSDNNKPLTGINYTISGTDSDNLALGVGSATEYAIVQNNTLPGYTVANTTQSFTIAQDPTQVNQFTVTKLPVTNDAFDFYYTDDEEKEQLITPGTPFTSSNFLTNPILYVKVKNVPGENLLAVTDVINFNEEGNKPHSLPLKDAEPVFPNHKWAITYTNDDPNIKSLALKVKLTETFTYGNKELNGILRFKSADGTVKEFNRKDDEAILKDKFEGLSTTEHVIEFAKGSKTGFFLDGAAINAAYQRGEIPPGASNYQAELTFTLADDAE